MAKTTDGTNRTYGRITKRCTKIESRPLVSRDWLFDASCAEKTCWSLCFVQYAISGFMRVEHILAVSFTFPVLVALMACFLFGSNGGT